MASASHQFWSSVPPLSHHYTHKLSILTSLRFAAPISSTNTIYPPKSLTVCFARTESGTSKSKEPDPKALLQDIVHSFDLPSDYFAKLPRDLRLDLNDAAFDLSNGLVLDECGQELGDTLLNLSRAWELADTSTSHSLVKKLPLIEAKLTGSAKSALGKRLISAGRRFQSMGKYGRGEPRKIAKAMIAAGRALSASPMPKVAVAQPQVGVRKLKFGPLRFKITPNKASLGSLIGIANGLFSWNIANRMRSLPDSSFWYKNDLVLAKSLKETFINFFSSVGLFSGFVSFGLSLLAIKLLLERDSDNNG